MADIHDSQTRFVSTRALLSLYRRGRDSALELLFAREVPRLRAWARGRLPQWARRAMDTADVVQEAVARTIPRLGTFEPQRERALQAYLRTAVDNRIKDEIRRAHSSPSLIELDGHVPLPDSVRSPLGELLSAEDSRRVARALATLSPSDQSAIVSRMSMGYSYEQIALLLNKRSADSARMTVTRAVEKLLRALQTEA